MLEETQDREETGNQSPGGSTSAMATQAQGKRNLKRDCSFDNDDLKPTKVPKTCDLTDEEAALTECASESVISTASLNSLHDDKCGATTQAGCSKDEHIPEEKSVFNEGKAARSKDDDDDEGLVLPVELMSLSDDVLLIIMSFLKPTDLLNLSLCCQRLSQVASDWSLWINVNFRPYSLLPGQLERFLPFLSDTTESICTRGFVGSRPLPRWRTECLSSELLLAVSDKCSYLHTFIAEEHCIDANKLKISAFPSTLEHLSLRRCEVINRPTDSSYFNCIFRYLPQLKVLELSDCTWLPPHSIMALSKLSKLEELYLDGCHLIRDCIPYASLAFSLGFPKLKVLDLRRTGLSDSELSCVNRSNRLTHLYLEYPTSVNLSNDDDDGELVAARACHLPGIVSDLGLRSLFISDKPHVLFNNALFNINSPDIIVMAPVKDEVSLCQIHTLVARNFNLVTDATLHELRFAQSLRYLDLTGTQITLHGLEVFRASRPEVTVLSSYDVEDT